MRRIIIALAVALIIVSILYVSLASAEGEIGVLSFTAANLLGIFAVFIGVIVALSLFRRGSANREIIKA